MFLVKIPMLVSVCVSVRNFQINHCCQTLHKMHACVFDIPYIFMILCAIKTPEIFWCTAVISSDVLADTPKGFHTVNTDGLILLDKKVRCCRLIPILSLNVDFQKQKHRLSFLRHLQIYQNMMLWKTFFMWHLVHLAVIQSEMLKLFYKNKR